MIANEPPPIVAPVVGVRVGASIPRDTLLRVSANDARPADRYLGTGPNVEVDVGARFFGIASLFAFGERTWFSCGLEDRCDGRSTLLGLAVRGELPVRDLKPFVELGIARRSLSIAPLVDGFGTSASITYAQRLARDADNLRGIETRVAVGAAWVLRPIAIELLCHVTFGRFSRWEHAPVTANLDPNVPLTNSDEVPEENRSVHTFVGLSLGVRYEGR